MLDWLKRLRAPSAERKLMAWHAPGRPVWPMRDPSAFAREGYSRNAIAYRCVRLIAEAAASAPLHVGPSDHPLARLLAGTRCSEVLIRARRNCLAPRRQRLYLPPLPGLESEEQPLAAVFASPWLGAHDVYAGPAQSRRATVRAPAIMGELQWVLWPGQVDRWDEGNVIRISLYSGALASVSREDVLNGANAFAIEADGEWEVFQAAECQLIEPGVYELRTFLRGRQGSAHAMRAPHPVGARIVKLDQRLARVDVGVHE